MMAGGGGVAGGGGCRWVGGQWRWPEAVVAGEEGRKEGVYWE